MPDIPQQPTPEVPKPSNLGEVPTIHTYKSDVAEYIKKEGKTLEDIAVAESQRTTNTLQTNIDNPERSRKAVLIISAVAIFLTLSFLILWLAFGRKEDDSNVGYTGTATSKAMFVSDVTEKRISIGSSEKNAAIEKLTTGLKQNEQFLVIYTDKEEKDGVKTPLTSREFLERIDVYPPDDLVRSLKNDFALGSIAGKARFLILKTGYYGGASSGMLRWEKTMENDLRDILGLSIPQNSLPPQSSTTQSFRYGFADLVIDNRDARVLRDASGNTILMYIFTDNETILITGNVNASRIVPTKLIEN